MLAWSEELITDASKTRNHGYDVIVGGGNCLLSARSLANLSAKPKTQIQQAPDAATTFPLVDTLP